MIWTSECNELREESIKKLFAQYNINSKTKIPPNHPILLEIQKRLQAIENKWAQIDGRTPMKIAVVLTPEVHLHRALTPQEEEYRSHSYNFRTKTCQISWHPGKYHLGLVSALGHEAEHHKQTLGYRLSPEQQKIIAAERACLSSTYDDLYWVQYTEVTARIAEAKACIEMISSHLSQLSLVEIEQLLSTSDALLTRMVTDTDHAHLMLLRVREREALQCGHAKIDLLKPHFQLPVFRINKTQDVVSFINSPTSIDIHAAAIDELHSLVNVLQHSHNKLSNRRDMFLQRQSQTKEQQTIDSVCQLARQRNIPILSSAPNPLPAITIAITSNIDINSWLTLSPDKMNLCIAPIFSTQPDKLFICYDQTPIHREYNTHAISQSSLNNSIMQTPELDAADPETCEDTEEQEER